MRVVKTGRTCTRTRCNSAYILKCRRSTKRMRSLQASWLASQVQRIAGAHNYVLYMPYPMSGKSLFGVAAHHHDAGRRAIRGSRTEATP